MSYEKIKDYINSLGICDGYVRFSHRDFKEKDIFVNKEVKVDFDNEDGFIIEAFFYKDNTSIAIRNFGSEWYIDEIDLSNVKDFDEYLTKIEGFNYKLRVAEIWVDEEDKFCENMKVKKLKKLAFAGFVGGKK